MYEHYKIYGPYIAKDGRKRIVAVYGKVKTTISYPKYLIEVSIGRHLKSDEQIHHIDGDFTNNDLNNLKIVKLGDHQRLHCPEQYTNQEDVCVWCNNSFIMTKQHIKSRREKRAIGRPGPFCSRHCKSSYCKEHSVGNN